MHLCSKNSCRELPGMFPPGKTLNDLNTSLETPPKHSALCLNCSSTNVSAHHPIPWPSGVESNLVPRVPLSVWSCPLLEPPLGRQYASEIHF